MTAFCSTSIPVRQAGSRSKARTPNVLFLCEVDTRWSPSLFRAGGTSGFGDALDLTGIAKEAAPAATLRHLGRRRAMNMQFPRTNCARASGKVTPEQTTGSIYVVGPLLKSPLLRIGDSRKKNKSPEVLQLAAALSKLQLRNSPQYPVRLLPVNPHPNLRFSGSQNQKCSQKTIPGPSFSLDKALLQQTSLAVWFFARANRFTNDSPQTALKRWSCPDES